MKYISVLLLFCILTFSVSAQSILPRYLNNRNEIAVIQGGLRVDSLLQVPNDTLRPSQMAKWGKTLPGLAKKGNIWYFYNPVTQKWEQFALSSMLNDLNFRTQAQIGLQIADSLKPQPIYVVNLNDGSDADSLTYTHGDTLFIKKIIVKGKPGNTSINRVVTDKTVSYQIVTDFSAPVYSRIISASKLTGSLNIDMGYTPVDMYVKDVIEAVDGTSPTVTYQIDWGTSSNATNTSVVASHTASSLAGITVDPALSLIPAGSYIRLKITAISGQVDNFNVTLDYRQQQLSQ